MNTLKSRFKREKFQEVYSENPLGTVLTSVPVEQDGAVVQVTTEIPEQLPKHVNYESFSAANVYALGETTPIELFNNMPSTEKLEYVQKLDALIDKSMSNN